jgi:hypothetical protein
MDMTLDGSDGKSEHLSATLRAVLCIPSLLVELPMIAAQRLFGLLR